jgi:hypothetical protein
MTQYEFDMIIFLIFLIIIFGILMLIRSLISKFKKCTTIQKVMVISFMVNPALTALLILYKYLDFNKSTDNFN